MNNVGVSGPEVRSLTWVLVLDYLNFMGAYRIITRFYDTREFSSFGSPRNTSSCSSIGVVSDFTLRGSGSVSLSRVLRVGGTRGPTTGCELWV